MKAIILSGGLGTRLRPLTFTTPKALVEIQGKTLTEHVLDILKSADITDIYLSIGYLADKIKDYFGDGSKFGVNITYVEEKEALGTAGPLNLIEKFESSFVMLNGDNLFDVDITKMLEFHKKNKAVATVALIQVDDPSHYGAARMEGDRIIEFVEKPKKGEEPSNLVSGGFYIFEPEVFDIVKEKNDEKVMFEYDVFPVLAKQEKLFGYHAKGQWFDIGSSEKLEIANKEWKGVGNK